MCLRFTICCAWCVLLLISTSGAQQTTSHGFKNESFHAEAGDRLSAINKIDLIRSVGGSIIVDYAIQWRERLTIYSIFKVLSGPEIS